MALGLWAGAQQFPFEIVSEEETASLYYNSPNVCYLNPLSLSGKLLVKDKVPLEEKISSLLGKFSSHSPEDSEMVRTQH